jgi:hypothetical protein
MFDFLKDFLTEKEYEVIQARYFNNQTLQAIGDQLGLTRERIRQIQNNGITKLNRVIDNTAVSNVIAEIENIMNKQSAVLSYEKLSLELDKFTTGELELIVDASNTIETIKKTQLFNHGLYLRSKIDKKLIGQIAKKIEKDIKKQEEPELLNEFIIKIKNNLDGYVSQKTIGGVIEVLTITKELDGKIGHIKSRIVNPKSIRDKAIIVLERETQPLHFREISKKIHAEKFDRKKVTLEAVHNELIRYNDFVLVGRGLYALSKWGYEKGTVKDVIYNILREHGALSKKEIVNKVLNRRQVKVGTISLNLQKYPEFKRIGRATYSL